MPQNNINCNASKDIEATKITSDWFLWMHHTVNEIPTESLKKYSWQKNHIQNLSGSSKAYKPNKISKKRNCKQNEYNKECKIYINIGRNSI